MLLVTAVGYASYALLPSDIDQRGPMLFVRWLLGYALVLPAVAAGIALGAFEGVLLDLVRTLPGREQLELVQLWMACHVRPSR